MTKTVKFIMVGAALAVLLSLIDNNALAQYRSTRSEVRELKSRFDGMVELLEGLAPTLERMDRQLGQLQEQVEHLESSGAKYQSASDVKELQRRLAKLEQQVEAKAGSTTGGVKQFAKLQSEYDILDARVGGLEQRLRTLARQDWSTDGSSNDRTQPTTRSRQTTSSEAAVVGCCPSCGSKLVAYPDGSIRHWPEARADSARYKYASSYDRSGGAYERYPYGYPYQADRDYAGAYYSQYFARPVSSSTQYDSGYGSSTYATDRSRYGYSARSQVYRLTDQSGTVRGYLVFPGRDR